MRPFLVLLLLLLPPGAARAEEPLPTALLALDPKAIDFARALPPPPVPGSLEAMADLEVVLQAQAWRTPEQVAWALRVDRGTCWEFAEVLGPWFQAGKLPVTERFLAEIRAALRPVGRAAKAFFPRLRPSKADARVRPCVPVPEEGSYPSGHALFFFAQGAALAEIFPESREALLERAHRLAWGRVLGGVHFPSDLQASRRLAEAVLAELRRQDGYRDGLLRCRAEAASARLEKAG